MQQGGQKTYSRPFVGVNGLKHWGSSFLLVAFQAQTTPDQADGKTQEFVANVLYLPTKFRTHFDENEK